LLHKDLRSDSIIFFPAQPNKDNNAKKYIPIDRYEKDFGCLYIMGYGLSRPDDVHDNADMQGGRGYSTLNHGLSERKSTPIGSLMKGPVTQNALQVVYKATSNT